jgi:hypothetical protein
MLVLGLLSLLRRRARLPRTPLVMTAIAYSILFCAAVVSYGNFGLIVRQRMQVWGFLIFIIFSLEPMGRTGMPPARGQEHSPRARGTTATA